MYRPLVATTSIGIALILATGCGGPPHVPILLWHSVGDGEDPRDRYDVSPLEFDEQIHLITSTFNANAITLQHYFDALEGKAKFPSRAVVLTFDDGRECLYKEAYPILRKYGAVGENFVVTEYLGEDESSRQRIRGHRMLLWREVEEMDHSGVMIAESHSRTHANLAKLSRMEQHREIFGSRMTIKRRLGGKPSFFAYPFGSLTSTTRQLVEEAGYRGALRVGGSTVNAYDLHRTSIWRSSTGVVRAALEQAFGKPP